jgi:acetyl-CoA carboxylase biotin carboxylase subunit
VALAQFPQGEGLRVDTHIESGALVPPFYDSMIAKVIATGGTREQARQRLAHALSEVRLSGVQTNVALQQRILATPKFAAGGVDTGFLGRLLTTP